MRTLCFWAVLIHTGLCASAQIPQPDDAPQPLSPDESAARFQLPAGFRIELVASEPLIRQPSGLAWDERGRLFVSELHGYNLEGQFDIEALNATGRLDREVRRIQASEAHKQAALQQTYGTIKLLRDRDGDGIMDSMQVFADRIPPAYGLIAARGGIIVACAPHILFLKDHDDDGKADSREILFTGFRTGALERGINAPQWGRDGWIYFGRGHTGGTITGPKLDRAVELGRSNFRIKPDGSAIEPVTGATGTFGHAMTEEGDRFVISTSRPGYFVTPLSWNHLARNPHVASPAMEMDAGGYTRVFPLAPPHPWRSKRASDPGFFKYYRDRYGASDSDPGGFFTSACSPLVYQDSAFPEDYQGNYFVCEPAQNLVHRALIVRDGAQLRLHRPAEEETSEFLASSDSWFHPMNLHHGPDGALYIVDMYREIIEDYSAIPRYLQQQYGLTNGMDHGRVWRLWHEEAAPAPSPDMSQMDPRSLALEVISPYFWRRQTARRLLVERKEVSVGPMLSHMARGAGGLSGVLNALYTLDGLRQLSDQDLARALHHGQAAVRRHALRLAEPRLRARPDLAGMVLALAEQAGFLPAEESEVTMNAPLLLQLAVTLGEIDDPRAIRALAGLARRHGAVPWMPTAILSSLYGREHDLLVELTSPSRDLGQAHHLLQPLGRCLAAARSAPAVDQALKHLADCQDASVLAMCLRGLRQGLDDAGRFGLSADGMEALHRMAQSEEAQARDAALRLLEMVEIDDPAQRQRWMQQAARDAANLDLSVDARLSAVRRLGMWPDAAAVEPLLLAWRANTPKVRTAVVDALFSRRARLAAILEALEERRLPPTSLDAFQRLTLLEHEDEEVRARARNLLRNTIEVREDGRWERFRTALAMPGDAARGEGVFREHCATCHQVGTVGFAVGPDLGAEFQRADEAILRDILYPGDVISAGYPTYEVDLVDGRTLHGILADESPTSLTLKQAAGLTLTLLRRNVASVRPLMVSLMPEALAETLSPRDVADVIAWLRQGLERGTARDELEKSATLTLFDDEEEFIAKLNQGGGRARLVQGGAFAGKASLAIEPPQRYAARIPGWNYRIAENPRDGEFRYLRLAWKTDAAEGVMIELAAEGHWPDAQSSQRRYYAGRNTTAWRAMEVSPQAPAQWQVRTLDLWKDNGDFTLTGIAPTAMGGTAYFDKVELLRDLGGVEAMSLTGREEKNSENLSRK